MGNRWKDTIDSYNIMTRVHHQHKTTMAQPNPSRVLRATLELTGSKGFPETYLDKILSFLNLKAILEGIPLLNYHLGCPKTPPGMYKTLSIMGHLAYQLVQDFFHQQYQCKPLQNPSRPPYVSPTERHLGTVFQALRERKPGGVVWNQAVF